MKPFRAFLVVGLSFLVSHAALAAGANVFTLATGYNYSEGDYGQDIPTRVHYVPVIGKWVSGAWTGKLTVPWISITGPGSVIDGTAVGAPRPERTESGLGDILGNIAWTRRVHPSGTALELSGMIKLPTADEDRFMGTGKTDYTLQAMVIQPAGRAYFTASGGRRFNGEGERFPMNDAWKATLGAGYRITDETALGAIWDWRAAQTAQGEAMSMASAYASHKLPGGWSAQAYAATGFTDGAPDLAVGFQISKSLDLW